MINKKITSDIKKYVKGTKEYNYIEPKDYFLYPIDLEFTLVEEDKYYFPKDKNGIPQKNYKSVGLKYNPTRVAAYGLANWNRFRLTQDQYSFNKFKIVLNWFMENHKDGKWYYNFDWGELKSPWISCMSQGEAISILVRGYIYYKDPKFLEIALLAIKPFLMEIDEGGVLNYLETKYIFFEEYPQSDSNHVLNGFLYSLIGVVELRKVLDKEHKLYGEVDRLIKEAIFCLENNIYRWDLGFISTYDLSNENHKIRNACTISYHNLHVSQLKFLGRELNNETLIEVAKKWDDYTNSFTNRIKALLFKSLYRLKNPAQR